MEIEWKKVEEVPKDADPKALRRKWEELALDVALLPEKNVRLVSDDAGTRVEISEVMYSYFFQD
jgi:hypothetical protein